jgi:hypothetical protein
MCKKWVLFVTPQQNCLFGRGMCPGFIRKRRNLENGSILFFRVFADGHRIFHILMVVYRVDNNRWAAERYFHPLECNWIFGDFEKFQKFVKNCQNKLLKVSSQMDTSRMEHTFSFAYTGCSFKFILKIGVEESIVNAPRITDCSCLNLISVFALVVFCGAFTIDIG